MQSSTGSVAATSLHVARRLLASRPSSSSTPLTIRTRAAPLPQRSVLEISGPDAQKFLKGLTCKDVGSLRGGYSGFLNASGRVLHTTFVFPLDATTYLLSHESTDHPAPLPSFLPPFRLRSKVRIRDVTSDWDAWSAWGDLKWDEGESPQRSWKPGSGGAAEACWEWENERQPVIRDNEVACWDLRAGFGSKGMGLQVLVPKHQQPSLSYDEATTSEYHLHRMLLGIPEGSAEIIPESALPLESCMDIHGGVDFRKGCYLGQELTVRTYHIGATRKRILPVRLFPLDSNMDLRDVVHCDGPVAHMAGADIVFHPPSSSPSKKPRSAGRLLSQHDHISSVGLGLVRLEMADRCWWSEALEGTARDWAKGDTGRLVVSAAGQTWGVYVGHGEAYSAVLRGATM